MNNNLILGVSGGPGSFSEEAALQYAARLKIVPSLAYLLDMEGVLNAIEKSTIDLGIFPIFNFSGGWVKPAFIAMGQHLFKPLDEVWLDVHQCLLVLPETPLKEIKTIVSHPQALAQCSQYLQKNFKNTEQIAWIDTAQAAKDLSKGKLDRSVAVIAPQRAATIYQLILMAENIQNTSPNHTIFIAVTQQPEI